MIAPSLLSANFTKLSDEIEMLNNSDADWLHLDIMDGVFVPNITFGFSIIKQIKKIVKKPLDVHLMIVEPERYIKKFKDAGADILTIHYEASIHLHRTLEEIRAFGIKAGVAINPHTNIELLKNVISISDLILIMSVNPGFGGQKFINETYEKIEETKKLINLKNKSCLIEVDGGVDISNAGKLYKSGADILVAGNAVFSAKNPSEMIKEIRSMKK
ncbi:MAG: ribulose-phosphate 3-epimerase [Bacteroidetes bacterium CG_4_10_14_3_um_filter_31_20]|nr:MAG: ribulose-phosphate 3-epimerase [Bacteroidetes bacterium CG_4_10_14_3_um_filter_31_20]